MSCTKHFLNLHWEHHTWRPQVTSWEVVTGEETNMWARVMYRDYVRCDKQEVCTECGAVRHAVSCLCDMAKGDRCTLLNAYKAEAPAVSDRPNPGK